MNKLNITNFYFYGGLGYEEKVINGTPSYRSMKMPEGTWRPLPHTIDRLLEHIHLFTRAQTRKYLYLSLGLDAACVTRCREGKNGGYQRIPDHWLVAMSEFTGLSLLELYAIGDIKPQIQHFKTHQAYKSLRDDVEDLFSNVA